ncbi:MAG: putative amidohydrolase YtcJ [Halioglobus sp.]
MSAALCWDHAGGLEQIKALQDARRIHHRRGPRQLSGKNTGSIEVGKFADLVTLSDNLFDLAPADISEVTVMAALLEGEIVYSNL